MSPPNHFLSGTAKPPPEKSKFLQTCNRLSLFLKENSNIRDLNFNLNAKFDATGTGTGTGTSLLDSIRSAKLVNREIDTGGLETSSPAEARTIDLLSSIDDSGEKAPNIYPQYVILDSSREVATATNIASSSKPDTKPKSAQMTIFYGGNVVVLDDVPADRARDLMLMAQKGQPQPKPNEKVELASTSKGQGEVQAKDSDLPIARRASLHKFLAKRKDRATVRAPYQVHNQSPGGSSSSSFDLNCNP